MLDIAKGIGIIAVVIGHSIPKDVLLAHFISMWHMPLFFLISGLCFNSEKYCNGTDFTFLQRRTRGLMLPLATAMLLFFAVYLLTGYDYYTPSMLLETRLPFAMWFLITLFVCQVLYWLWCGIMKTAGKSLSIKVEPILAIVGFVLMMVFNKFTVSLPFSLQNVSLAIVFYGIGHMLRGHYFMLMKRTADMRPLARLSIIGAELICLFLYIIYYKDAISFADIHLPEPYLLAIVVSLMGIDGVMRVSSEVDNAKVLHSEKLATALKYLGVNSLIILTYHMFWMRLCKDFLRPIIGIGIEPLLVWPLLLITIAIVNKYAPWMVGKSRTSNK